MANLRVGTGITFDGATGNFNAHHVAFPNVDWERFANEFIEKNLKKQMPLKIPFRPISTKLNY